MKKVAKAILFGIIICCLVFTLSACVDNDKPTPDVPDVPDEPIDTSAYGQLTEHEKEIFDVLVTKLNQFVNPTSVRILGVVYLPDINCCHLNLQATNRLGATVTQDYTLCYDDFSSGDYSSEKGDFRANSYIFSSIYTYKTEDDDVSVGNLNKAIVEYWEEQGLL